MSEKIPLRIHYMQYLDDFQNAKLYKLSWKVYV